jgi:hypothetical protein
VIYVVKLVQHVQLRKLQDALQTVRSICVSVRDMCIKFWLGSLLVTDYSEDPGVGDVYINVDPKEIETRPHLVAEVKYE